MAIFKAHFDGTHKDLNISFEAPLGANNHKCDSRHRGERLIELSGTLANSIGDGNPSAI